MGFLRWGLTGSNLTQGRHAPASHIFGATHPFRALSAHRSNDRCITSSSASRRQQLGANSCHRSELRARDVAAVAPDQRYELEPWLRFATPPARSRTHSAFTVRTADTHVQRAYRKIGVSTRAAATLSRGSTASWHRKNSRLSATQAVGSVRSSQPNLAKGGDDEQSRCRVHSGA